MGDITFHSFFRKEATSSIIKNGWLLLLLPHFNSRVVVCSHEFILGCQLGWVSTGISTDVVTDWGGSLLGWGDLGLTGVGVYWDGCLLRFNQGGKSCLGWMSTGGVSVYGGGRESTGDDSLQEGWESTAVYAEVGTYWGGCLLGGVDVYWGVYWG